MGKKYLDIDVHTAAIKRIEYIFNTFDNVLVAFSGGKDSGVCLNLCYDYAKEHNILDRLYMYHLDYEAQYEMTTEYVTRCFEGYPEIKKFWLCLPVGADCGCNMRGSWVPWEKNKRDIWVRDYPESEYLINEDNCPFDMRVGERDYDVQDHFGKWFEKEYGSTAIIIGLRADESLNRYRAVTKNGSYGHDWMTGNNAYIIYDWIVEDIWTYNAKTGHDYNKLYDLYYQAGLSVHEMRVANPFHSCGSAQLKLYKVIDPKNWARLIGRTEGVSFAGIYGGTTAMGWKSITKPEGHTWKSYLEFLLSTLDDELREHYEKIFRTSIQFWKDKGGALNDEAMEDAIINGGKDSGEAPYSNNKRLARFEEYPDDCDSVYFKDLPSYKRMCVCILKNDYYCKYMGFAQTKEDLKKRREAIKRYENL